MSLNLEELENDICELVKVSLANKQHSEKISFSLSEKTIASVWKYKFIDLRNYICVIHSNDIRHVHKEHGYEVEHICKIPSYLEKFASIEKSKTRDIASGRDVPCFVFTKKMRPKNIQMVKLHISRNKILRLKTMYEV